MKVIPLRWNKSLTFLPNHQRWFVEGMEYNQHHWRIQGGCEGCLSLGPISFIFMQFPGKFWPKKYASSRMRTVRLLPISPSMHCRGGVCSQGVCLWSGGFCLWSGGSASGLGDLPLGGVCLWSWMGGWCIPACTGADTPCKQNDWPTGVKT